MRGGLSGGPGRGRPMGKSKDELGKMPKANKKNLWRFLSFYKPVKGLLLFSFFGAILIGVGTGMFPFFSSYVTEKAEAKDMDALIIGLSLMFGMMIVRVTASFFVSYLGHQMGGKMEKHMRTTAMDKLHKLPTSHYDKTSTGTYISRVVNDLADIPEFAHHTPEDLVSGLTIFAFGFTFAFMNSWIVAVALLIVFILGVLFTYWRQKSMRSKRMKIRELTSDMSAFVASQAESSSEIKSFGAQKFESERFDEKQRKFFKSRKEFFLHESIMTAGSLFTIFFTTFTATAVGTILVARGDITLSTLIGLTATAAIIINPMNKFVAVYGMLSLGMSAVDRYYDFMALPEEENFSPEVAPTFRGRIEFQNVYFGYTNKENEKIDVLKNFNLRIEAGQKVGLVGETGIGKSTIFKLLLRFYEIDKGSILIDGIDIRQYDINTLRRQLGYIQQAPTILDDTIRNNIIYGKPDASDSEIRTATKRAQIDNVINNLADGFETIAGTKGAKLSGGQKQRVAIARAFLADSSIILLDEATSALDNKTEKKIKESIEDLAKDKTALIIAHRLTTIKDVDRVLVIGKYGQILEDGTHDELLENEEYYYNLNTI